MQKEVKITICPPRYADGYVDGASTLLGTATSGAGLMDHWDAKTPGAKKKAVKGKGKGK